METKLIMQKGYRHSIIILLLTSLFSCTTNKHIGSTEEQYVLAFKKAVLYGCINGATDGEFQKFLIENNDMGTAIETAVLYHAVVLEAQEVGVNLAKNIEASTYSDYQGRKPIFSNCISFAFSKKVDSLALARYKELKKGEMRYIYE
ncbi:MAG: hypothetical protein WD554_03485 [Flavobacteriaceae bacterium]